MAAHFEIVQPVTSSRLVISAPGASLVSPWLVMILLLFGLAICYPASRSARRVLALSKTPAELSSAIQRFWLIAIGGFIGALLLFWLISYNSGSILLDRSTNTATVRARMTFFLPARSRTTQLDTIERAVLESKPNSRRIRLVARRGPDLAYPVWTGRAGQEEAVRAINSFLGAEQH